MKFLVKIFLASILLTGTISCQNETYIKENYNKAEFRIPMRDGITLFTSVFSPKDTTQIYPIMLWRTPYSVAPYGEDYRDVPERFLKEGYIIVYQDVRGKFMSEGKYVNMRPHIPRKEKGQVDESTDTYDTVEWLVNNIPNNNGNVGMWGISYPGFYASIGTINSHPALKAVSPQAPICDWFIGDDMHHNGALALILTFNFFSVFDVTIDTFYQTWPARLDLKSPDAYTFFRNVGGIKNLNELYLHYDKPFWNKIMEHDTYDEFWKARNIRPHLGNAKPAVLTVGGWYDGENLFGALETYKNIEKTDKHNKNYLVMGPWTHGGWDRTEGDKLGDVYFGSKTSKFYQDSIEMPFFNYHLKGKGSFKPDEVVMFETGTNIWQRYPVWPPKNVKEKTYYLNDNFTITESKPNSEDDSDSYISDPSKPVPYSAKIQDAQTFYYKPYLNEDQRFASFRPDVLSYSTGELTEDVTAVGKIETEIFFTCSTTDADIVVKVIDVYPDSSSARDGVEFGGYQELIRADIFRTKFRNSFSNPVEITPGKVEKLKFSLQDINHTFKKGHKIMIQIQSSWFPLYDMNPQVMTKITQFDKEFTKSAKIDVLRNKYFYSNVKFSILDR